VRQRLAYQSKKSISALRMFDALLSNLGRTVEREIGA